jgi:hypothetical protein
METETAALKEWAVAIKALSEGRQILIMRKGGIREETRDFRLESESFFLFPTYEHQKKALVKEEYRDLLDETLKVWSPDKPTVPVDCWAEAVADIEVFDQSELERLMPYHIWTDTFAEERLKWKKTKPLHLILLRVYKLDTPVDVPLIPEYTGCKSWLRFPDELAAAVRIPVLNDTEFAAKVAEIRSALGR